jgi:hypothetical protein
MKTELFKKLIKEAVREVLKEELGKVLTEQLVQKQTPKVTKFETYKPVIAKPVVRTGNPIADLMAETHASMMVDPTAGHYTDMSQAVSAPGLRMESGEQPIMMEESFARPEPGLDISQFDFVKKAASVYKASVEKDKARFGG